MGSCLIHCRSAGKTTLWRSNKFKFENSIFFLYDVDKTLNLISDGKLTDNKLVGFNSWCVTFLITAATAFPTSQESWHGWPTSSIIGKNVFPLNLNLILFMGVMLQGHSQSIVLNNKKQNNPKTKIKSKEQKNYYAFKKHVFLGFDVVLLNTDLLSHQHFLLYNHRGNQICAVTAASYITVHLFHSKCDFRRRENEGLMQYLNLISPASPQPTRVLML